MTEKIDYDRLHEMARELGRPSKTLIALGPINDPFYAGVPFRRKTADWFLGLWNRFQFPNGVHLRRIHYVLVSQDPPVAMPNGMAYENTTECWSALNDASMSARALRLVDPAAFVDRKHPEPITAEAEEASEPSIGLHTEDDWSLSPPRDLPDWPSLGLSGPTVRQRYMVEIWCEKSTINDILLPLHRRYGANLQVFEGESSDIRCRQLVDRAIRDGRPVRILYVSDFDPAGASMPVAAARKIEHRLHTDGLDLDIQIRPILLTHDQCAEYRLPRIPIKETERRAARFEERFGEGATELDALEALHPGEMSRILTDEIGRYYDDDLAESIDDHERVVRDDLDEINEHVADSHADAIEQLESDYADLRRRYQAEIETISARRDGIARSMRQALNEQQPSPDAYEWPEPEDGNEDDDPLFDSTRDYVEQMDRYKRHQGKPIAGGKPGKPRKIVGIATGP